MSREAFFQKKTALADRIAELQVKRAEVENDQQEYQKDLARKEDASREIEGYLSASDMDDEAFKSSMYAAIERVIVFSNRHIEVKWKFADLFESSQQKEREAV